MHDNTISDALRNETGMLPPEAKRYIAELCLVSCASPTLSGDTTPPSAELLKRDAMLFMRLSSLESGWSGSGVSQYLLREKLDRELPLG
jgi:hypothetical protein